MAQITRKKKTERVLKVILIGDPGVGKSSLINTYVHGKFKHSYQVTIGLDVSSKIIELTDQDGKKEIIKLSIHDIGGQERFNTIRHLFYPGAHLVMFVYDVTRLQSLKNLQTVWETELAQYNPPEEGGENIQKILVGNKADLEDLRVITDEEAEQTAKELGCLNQILASAKENENVDEAFTQLARAFLVKTGVFK